MAKQKSCYYCGSTVVHSCPGPKLGKWINLNLPLGPIYKKGSTEQEDTANKLGIVKAGVLLEMKDKDGYSETMGYPDNFLLVGDINDKGGGCDDCHFGRNRIVKRYKVVWERKQQMAILKDDGLQQEKERKQMERNEEATDPEEGAH